MDQPTEQDPSRYPEWVSSEDISDLERTALALKNASKPTFAEEYMQYFVKRLHVIGELNTALAADASSASRDPHLGVVFRSRLHRLRTFDDLERSTIEPRLDVDLPEEGDYETKAFPYNAVGRAFRNRYERLAEPEDIDCAVTAARLAATYIPEGDDMESEIVTGLCIALQMRFLRKGNLDDLEGMREHIL